jgi:c(7)-type cytochrome triheme protein
MPGLPHGDGQVMTARSVHFAVVLATALVASLLSAVASPEEIGDVKMKRAVQTSPETPVSYFPHWIHRMQFKCAACHDELFKMKAGTADKITMDSFLEGKACGACHDGKKAFESNFDTCTRCHRE